eukprot:9470-Heterococcus_DN1.PRE.1
MRHRRQLTLISVLCNATLCVQAFTVAPLYARSRPCSSRCSSSRLSMQQDVAPGTGDAKSSRYMPIAYGRSDGTAAVKPEDVPVQTPPDE